MPFHFIFLTFRNAESPNTRTVIYSLTTGGHHHEHLDLLLVFPFLTTPLVALEKLRNIMYLLELQSCRKLHPNMECFMEVQGIECRAHNNLLSHCFHVCPAH